MFVGYFPYTRTNRSVEASWLTEHLGVDVILASEGPSLNDGPLPPHETDLDAILGNFAELPGIVFEGPGGFLWAALLRARGFSGTATILPYVNPRRWDDVAAAAVYRHFARADDRVFVGSTPSAGVYGA